MHEPPLAFGHRHEADAVDVEFVETERFAYAAKDVVEPPPREGAEHVLVTQFVLNKKKGWRKRDWFGNEYYATNEMMNGPSIVFVAHTKIEKSRTTNFGRRAEDM